jgi:hypothetical protein
MNWKFWSRRKERSPDLIDRMAAGSNDEDSDLAIEALHISLLRQREVPIEEILQIEVKLFGKDMRQLLLEGYKPSLALQKNNDVWTVYGRME